jgi:hypothetical protein
MLRELAAINEKAGINHSFLPSQSSICDEMHTLHISTHTAMAGVMPPMPIKAMAGRSKSHGEDGRAIGPGHEEITEPHGTTNDHRTGDNEKVIHEYVSFTFE